MSQARSNPEYRRPLLLVAIGRQRVGKTTFLSALGQSLRKAGARLVLWNVDQQNTTNHLGLFFNDVQVPRTSEHGDVRTWLEGRIADQVEHRYDAILDVGGGESAFTRLLADIDLIRSLQEEGIRVVLVNVMGPDQADLDYLARLTADGLCNPEALLLVLNGGLVLSGHSVRSAFADVFSHPVFAAAEDGGAKAVVFPALGCMRAVTDRGLTFVDAAAGASHDVLGPLAFFDRQRVRRWLTQEWPAFIAQIPPLWLPATREGEGASEMEVDAAD